jgi:hypothetical protein
MLAESVIFSKASIHPKSCTVVILGTSPSGYALLNVSRAAGTIHMRSDVRTSEFCFLSSSLATKVQAESPLHWVEPASDVTSDAGLCVYRTHGIFKVFNSFRWVAENSKPDLGVANSKNCKTDIYTRCCTYWLWHHCNLGFPFLSAQQVLTQ